MVGSPLPHVPPPLPRRNRSVLASLASRPLAAFPVFRAGRLPHHSFRGLRSVHIVAARVVAEPPRAALVVGVLQPMSLPPSSAPTATGWSDSCRAGFAPAEEWHLVTAHRNHPLSDPGHPAAQADDRDTHMPRAPEQGRNGRTHRQHRRSARSRRVPAGGAGLVLVRALRGATGRRTSGASTCRASERLGYHVHLAPDDERLAAVHVQARHRLPVALRPWRVLDVAHVRRVNDDRVAGVVTLESHQSRHVSSSALGLDLCR